MHVLSVELELKMPRALRRVAAAGGPSYVIVKISTRRPAVEIARDP
jgi:hypothetical protein